MNEKTNEIKWEDLQWLIKDEEAKKQGYKNYADLYRQAYEKSIPKKSADGVAK